MAAARLMTVVLQLAEDAKAAAVADSLFEPKGTSITINKIEGGTASNILAKHCAFVFDVRSPAEDEPMAYVRRFEAHARAVERDMQAIAPEASIKIDLRVTPPVAHRAGGPAEDLARALTGDNSARAVAYAAEAGQFQDGGFSTVVCGPGSIAQAHQPDEFVSVEQLALGCRFFEKLIARLSA
jgi:acetylornithine deacetylase